MHTIVERKVNREDFHSPESLEKPGAAVWGCAVVGFGFLPTLLLGAIGRNAFGFWGMLGGALIGAALFALLMLISWNQRKQAGEFRSHGTVQEISVENATCYEIDLFNSDPVLVFDIGQGQLLALQGQWLREPETYGRDLTGDDPDEKFFNGLPHPASFPSEHFTLIRKSENGDVISIQPRGEYLQPELIDATLYAREIVPQSQLISGSPKSLLDDVLKVAKYFARESR